MESNRDGEFGQLFEREVEAGNRLYSLRVQRAGDGTRFLVISERAKNGSAGAVHEIIVFERHLPALKAGWDAAMALLGLEAVSAEATHSGGEPADGGGLAAAAEEAPDTIRSRNAGESANTGKVPSYVEKARKNHPRAYMPWSESEDAELATLFANGSSPRAIADHLQRQPGAIRSRLKKLGLKR